MRIDWLDKSPVIDQSSVPGDSLLSPHWSPIGGDDPSKPPAPPGVNDIQMVRFSPSISPYHWNWFSAFCWFLQSKTFHGCQGESFLLKVNGFNWIFPKQKTDNERNFVPISLLNMKVFWDTPSDWYVLIRAKIKQSDLAGMFCCVWRPMKGLLVWRSGDLDRDGVFTSCTCWQWWCDDETGLSLSGSC